MATEFKPCAIAGCKSNSHYKIGGKRGWCRDHYGRWQRHGDPLGGRTAEGDGEKWLLEHAGYERDDCLIWPFALQDGRYATCTFRGIKTAAHRAMCELKNGAPPSEGHHAAHSCGKGHLKCVSPVHLHWATPKENQEEMIEHGTSPRGGRNGHAKLTEGEVRRIRLLVKAETLTDVAATFGVSIATVSMIKSRKVWGWLD